MVGRPFLSKLAGLGSYGITQRLNPPIAAIFTRREYGINAPHGGRSMILRQSNRFSGRKPEIYLVNDEFKLKI